MNESPGRPLVALTFAIGLGAAIWAASPFIVHEAEPWDAEQGMSFLYYPAALVIAGLLCGLLTPRRPGISYAGLVVGQVAYMTLFQPAGPFVILGIVFLLFFTVLAMAGWAIARVMLHLLRAKQTAS